MVKLIIFGAGGLGREVLAVLRALEVAGHDIACLGFAIDPEFASGVTLNGLPIHLGLEVLRGDPDLRVVVALGDPARRRRAAREIERLAGPRFATVIHPAAVIGVDVTIGEGTMVLGPVSITTNVSIGRHVLINPLVSVAHDCGLQDFVTLAPAVALAGAVDVAEGAELGIGARVIPRQTIGAWSLVGAGATVTQSVAADTTVGGVPARVIARRPPGWYDDV